MFRGINLTGQFFGASSRALAVVAPAIIAAVLFPANAQAKEAPWGGNKAWTFCWSTKKNVEYYTSLFEATIPESYFTIPNNHIYWEPDGEIALLINPKNESRDFPNDYICESWPSREKAESMFSGYRGLFAQATMVEVAPAALEGPVKTLLLPFFKAENYNQEGFTEASIKLRYKFLVCAGNLQVAYALDRKSLFVSDTYLIKQKGAIHKVPAPPAPPAPLTVALNATVTLESPDYVVARFKDAIAGEALGMGCVTGQTKTLGTAKSLIPANSSDTPAAKRAWLSRLNLLQIGTSVPMVLRVNTLSPGTP